MKDKDCVYSETASQESAKARANREVDRQSEDSFPASDPPSYPGSPIIGAPERRRASGQLPSR